MIYDTRCPTDFQTVSLFSIDAYATQHPDISFLTFHVALPSLQMRSSLCVAAHLYPAFDFYLFSTALEERHSLWIEVVSTFWAIMQCDGPLTGFSGPSTRDMGRADWKMGNVTPAISAPSLRATRIWVLSAQINEKSPTTHRPLQAAYLELKPDRLALGNRRKHRLLQPLPFGQLMLVSAEVFRWTLSVMDQHSILTCTVGLAPLSLRVIIPWTVSMFYEV